jgi:glycosyltransferase involved in cell wall biosynthesis
VPKQAVHFYGWIPAENVLSIAAGADFGVLLRDRARWADACFPCKVAEFQALGVPMLCNLTSDLNKALQDGKNSLIVRDVSVAGLVKTVKRALALTPLQKERMRRRSLESAADYFDYRRYVAALRAFLGHVCEIPSLQDDAYNVLR